MKIINRNKLTEKTKFDIENKIYSEIEKLRVDNYQIIIDGIFMATANYLTNNEIAPPIFFQYMKKYVIELEKSYKQAAKDLGYDAWQN